MKHFFRIAFLLLLITLCCLLSGSEDYDKWKQKQVGKFKNYRSKQDEQFHSFLENNWKEFKLVSSKQEDVTPKPEVAPIINNPISTTPVADDKIIEIIDLPKPKKTAIEAVEKDDFMDVYNPDSKSSIEIDFWGLPLVFGFDENPEIELMRPVDKKAVADFWFKTGNYDFSNAIDQLTEYKNKLKLNDWNYCKLTNALAEEISDGDIALSRLYSWFFLIKTGFDIKVGYNSDTINLLIPTNRTIYGVTYININNRKYYLITFDDQNTLSGGIYTYDQKYPDSDDLLDLDINHLPEINANHISKDYSFTYKKAEYTVTIDFNETTATFFEDYPQTDLEVYLKAPMSSEAEYSLSKQFKPILEGKSQREAVNILLRFVQTAFDYQTDNDQFGREKSLIGIETLYYPYSDCEDRSVIFSYLIRSLLDLEVIVLDYPGHIATAVYLEGQITGDTIQYGNKIYQICDPTYINAEIGMAMPKFRKKNPEIITF